MPDAGQEFEVRGWRPGVGGAWRLGVEVGGYGFVDALQAVALRPMHTQAWRSFGWVLSRGRVLGSGPLTFGL